MSYKDFAVLDLGSNSFHLMIGRFENDEVRVLYRTSEQVRLADGLDDNGFLSQDLFDRAFNVLAKFHQILQNYRITNVKTVATYTLRQARNSQDFLEGAKNYFPFDIDIITGEQEARYIYKGASHIESQSGKKLVVDIGGGSTEIAIGDGFDVFKAVSTNMGCVSFANKFFKEFTQENFDRALVAALELIKDLKEDYQAFGWQEVWGSSGSIKTVMTVLKSLKISDKYITLEALDSLADITLSFKKASNIKLDGLRPGREDLLLPGIAILKALFLTFEIDKMYYSNGAVREGILFSLLEDLE